MHYLLDPAIFARQSNNVTDVTRALAQLEEIHAHLARTEVYRGWRSLPVALSGVAGIAAAGGHVYWFRVIAPSAGVDPRSWVLFWLAVALLALVIGCAELMWRYLREESPTDRRRTEQVALQFLPALAVGACITVGVLRINPALASTLPGLWSLLFAVGIFSARPYLPTMATLVSTFYAITGVALLWWLGTDTLPPAGLPVWFSWTVGGVFGAGQLIAAAVLYWNLERPMPGMER